MYHYVCCVQRKDDDDGEVCVLGLSINNSAADEFIIKDEKDYVVNFDNILEILEDPKIIMKKRSISFPNLSMFTRNETRNVTSSL